MFRATQSETNYTSFEMSPRRTSKDRLKHDEIWVPIGCVHQALHRGNSV
jgi:hypothetical protein